MSCRSVLLAALAILLVAPSAHALLLNPAYSTEFSGTDLPSHMSWDVPSGAPSGQSYSVGGGWLTMTTRGRTDLWGTSGNCPKVLESAPTGDIRIETLLDSNPDTNYEHAGLILYSSDAQWVRLIEDTTSGKVNLQSNAGHHATASMSTTADLVLRADRSGNAYQFSVSDNGGTSFTSVGSRTLSWTPASIGLTVVSTPTNNVFSADYDYFHVYTESVPPVPEPASCALLALAVGGVGVGLKKRRKKQ